MFGPFSCLPLSQQRHFLRMMKQPSDFPTAEFENKSSRFHRKHLVHVNAPPPSFSHTKKKAGNKERPKFLGKSTKNFVPLTFANLLHTGITIYTHLEDSYQQKGFPKFPCVFHFFLFLFRGRRGFKFVSVILNRL
jgi:hypothetical protein